MDTATLRIKKILRSNRIGLALFGVLTAGTAILICSSSVSSWPGVNRAFAAVPHTLGSLANQLKFSADLSQNKLVQGADGIVYLKVDIETPALETLGVGNQGTDMVVVLDRSGSMGENNKLPFAKEAVKQLIQQLSERDRFAFVTFDNSSEVHAGLTPVSNEGRAYLNRLVQRIALGGGTNMGEGLLRAREVLQSQPSERRKRVLLLSDGHANQGVTDPAALAELVKNVTKDQAVLSTIGMGLGFNEALVSLLADHGMGNYSYLENLASLGTILAKDLNDARGVYASKSEIEVTPGPGVSVADAGGYPIMPSPTGILRIPTGQLLSNSKKSFTVTFKAPTGNIAEFELGKVSLHYTASGKESSLAIASQALVLAVLEPARREEARASINTAVFADTWTANNLGLTQKEVREWTLRGDKAKASESIANYRRQLAAAESESGVAIMNPEVSQELRVLQHDVDAAFAGSPAEQQEKQNRLGKGVYSKALKNQRGK